MARIRMAALAMLAFIPILLRVGDAGAEPYVATAASAPASDILEIDDGSSIRLVVLHGIIAPNSRSPASRAAKLYLEERVLGREVHVEPISRKAGLDYVKVRVGSNRRSLNEELLERGLAKWDRLSAPHDETYRSLQAAAKEKQIGVWSKVDPRLAVPHEYDLSIGGTKAAVRVEADGIKTLRIKGDGAQQKIVGFEAMILAERAERGAEMLRVQEAQQREMMERQRREGESNVQMQPVLSTRSGFGHGNIRVTRQTIMDIHGNILFSGVTMY